MAGPSMTGWKLDFHDSFTGTGLSSSWFTYGTIKSGSYGFTWRDSNNIVDSNGLTLRASKDSSGNWSCGDAQMTGTAQSWATKQYGWVDYRVEFVMKLPTGNGAGAYGLMWPSDDNWVSGSGPEVDIFETPFGSGKIATTLHYTNGGNGSETDNTFDTSVFNTYTMEHTKANGFRFWINGSEKTLPAAWNNNNTQNHPMVPGFSAYVGVPPGNWGGGYVQPDSNTPNPSDTVIQSIDVYIPSTTITSVVTIAPHTPPTPLPAPYTWSTTIVGDTSIANLSYVVIGPAPNFPFRGNVTTVANTGTAIPVTVTFTATGDRLKLWDAGNTATQDLSEAATLAIITATQADAIISVLQGQSNAIYMLSENIGGGWDSIYGPIVQNLTGITHKTYSQRGDFASSDPSGAYTCLTGSPSYQTVGDSSGLILNPAAGTVNNPTTWPPGAWGTNLQTYLHYYVNPTTQHAGITPVVTSNTAVVLHRFHSENDSKMSTGDSTLYAVANKKIIDNIRTYTGVSASQMAVFYTSPAFWSGSTTNGLDSIRSAWIADINDGTRNAHWGSLACYDVADRGDASHADQAGDHQDASRMAITTARWIYDSGQTTTDLSWLPKQGPRIIGLSKPAANQLSVQILHDKGTDLIPPTGAAALNAWLIKDSTGSPTVTAQSRLDATHVLLTLSRNLTGTDAQITLDFCQPNGFYGLNSLFTDNWHTSAVVKPAAYSNITNTYAGIKLPITKADRAVAVGATIIPSDGPNAMTLPPPALALPSGIFSVHGQIPVPASIYANSIVVGVSVSVGWNVIQPTDAATYTWTTIDTEVTKATNAGKQIILEVVPGVNTPAWVYAAGAVGMPFLWYLNNTFALCSSQKFPLPWDAIYINAWKTFIAALGARYAGSQIITGVKVTGVNTITDELLLTYDIATTTCGVTTALPSSGWSTAGYKPSLVTSSWNTFVNAFNTAFPRQVIIASIGNWGFPPVSETGVVSAGGDRTLGPSLTKSMIAIVGARAYLANNGANVNYIFPRPAGVAASVPIATQTSGLLNDTTTCRVNAGVTPCDPATMATKVVANANAFPSAYLEIFQSDLGVAALQAPLAQFNVAAAKTPLQIANDFKNKMGAGVHVPRGQQNILQYKGTTLYNSTGLLGFWQYLFDANLTHVCFSYPWTGDNTVAAGEAPRNVSTPSITDAYFTSQITAAKNANANGLLAVHRLMDNLNNTDGVSTAVRDWITAATKAYSTSGLDPTMNLICVWGEPVASDNATWNPLNIYVNKLARANLPQSAGWILGGGGSYWNADSHLNEGVGRALSQLPDGTIDDQVIYLIDNYPDATDLKNSVAGFVTNMKAWSTANNNVPIIMHEVGDFNSNIVINNVHQSISPPNSNLGWDSRFQAIMDGATNWAAPTLWDIHNNDGAMNMAIIGNTNDAALPATTYTKLKAAALTVYPSGGGGGGGISPSVTGAKVTARAGGVTTFPKAPVTTVTFIVAGPGSWLVPNDWNPVNNTLQLLAGGGGSTNGAQKSDSGAGAAFSGMSNLVLTPGVTVSFNLGIAGVAGTGLAAGDGGDSWFNGVSLTSASLSAQGGRGGKGDGSAALGGQASAGIGSTKFSGGNGANGSVGVASGGGAAGPLGDGGFGISALSGTFGPGGGAGNNGSDGGQSTATLGGTGGNNVGGTGGGLGSPIGTDGRVGTNGGGGGGTGGSASGGDGGPGKDFLGNAVGSGGGGGASSFASGGAPNGGTGGLYGGGAGAVGSGTGAPGGSGLLVIRYGASIAGITTVGARATTGAGNVGVSATGSVSKAIFGYSLTTSTPSLPVSTPGGSISLTVNGVRITSLAGLVATSPATNQVSFLITSGSTWQVPSGFNKNNNQVETTAGGGGGCNGTLQSDGGAGSGYSTSFNLQLIVGSLIPINIGAAGTAGPNGGAGSDTCFNGTTLASLNVATGVGAQGGQGGPGTNVAALGGQASAGVGTTKFSGGNGAGNGAGGGAAGPHGNGGAGGALTSLAGGKITGGGGGGADGGFPGSPGGATLGGAGGNDRNGANGGAGGAADNSGSPGQNGGGGGGGGQELTVGPSTMGGAGGDGVAFSNGSKGPGGGGGTGGAGASGIDSGGPGGNFGGGGGAGVNGGNAGGIGGGGAILVSYSPAAFVLTLTGASVTTLTSSLTFSVSPQASINGSSATAIAGGVSKLAGQFSGGRVVTVKAGTISTQTLTSTLVAIVGSSLTATSVDLSTRTDDIRALSGASVISGAGNLAVKVDDLVIAAGASATTIAGPVDLLIDGTLISSINGAVVTTAAGQTTMGLSQNPFVNSAPIYTFTADLQVGLTANVSVVGASVTTASQQLGITDQLTGASVSVLAGVALQSVQQTIPPLGQRVTVVAGQVGLALSLAAFVGGRAVTTSAGTVVVGQFVPALVAGASVSTLAGMVLLPVQIGIAGAVVVTAGAVVSTVVTPSFVGASVLTAAGVVAAVQARVVTGATATAISGTVTAADIAALIGASAIVLPGSLAFDLAGGVQGASVATTAGLAGGASGVFLGLAGPLITSTGIVARQITTKAFLSGVQIQALAGSTIAFPTYNITVLGASVTVSTIVIPGATIRYATRGATLWPFRRGAALPPVPPPPGFRFC